MKQYKPTTSSRRQMTSVDYSVLSGDKPYKPLLKKLKSYAGRNNRGVITVRHQGGGNKKLYRIIDFKQNKIDIPAKVETIEYDPYRSAFISRILYKDGERRYILAYKDIKVGDEIITSDKPLLKVGNRLPLKNIPFGYQVHNIESRPGSGGKYARSAGSYAEILGNEKNWTILRFNSKEIRRLPLNCFASIGQVSNPDYNLVNIGKAGRSRWLGIRPTVRGTVMNPVDHPYGGGEGKQPRGTRRPKTAWGKTTGGHRTRNKKKWSTKFIIKRRS